MMNLPHISSLYSASWVSWVLFGLLVIGLSNPFVRMVGVVWHGVFSQSERSYAPGTHNWMNEITLYVFQLGIASMLALLWGMPYDNLSLIVYVKVLGIVGGIYLIQTLLLHVIGYVFLSPKRKDVAMAQYGNIRTLVCVALFPIVLLLVNVSMPMASKVLFGTVITLFILVLLGKSIQLFYTHPLCILYIFLYILCLEILPMGMSVFVVKHFV